MGEDAVHAGLAHFVVACWIDEEAEGGVEVATGLADGAYFCWDFHLVRGIEG